MSDAAIRRAALEEAVRAVCDRCQRGGEPVQNFDIWVHSYRYDGGSDEEVCPASGIHNLLAAEP